MFTIFRNTCGRHFQVMVEPAMQNKLYTVSTSNKITSTPNPTKKSQDHPCVSVTVIKHAEPDKITSNYARYCKNAQ